MCEPTTIVLVGTAVVGAASAAYQNNQAKKAADANQENIIEDFTNQISDMRNAQEQIGDDADTEMSERVREARAEAARVSVIAGEYADGNNTKRLQNEVQQRAADDVSTIELNRDRQQAEIGRDSTAAAIRARGGIRSNPRPSNTGLALNVAGSALGAYNSYNRSRPPASNTQPYVPEWNAKGPGE